MSDTQKKEIQDLKAKYRAAEEDLKKAHQESEAKIID